MFEQFIKWLKENWWWFRLIRYLSTHQNVRDAIAWEVNGQLIKYQDWSKNSDTSQFKKTLIEMFKAKTSNKNISFSFSQETDPDTGKPRIAPGLQNSHMSLKDASEIYLAHIAFSLWVEIEEKVNWRLHQYSKEHLELLLNGKCFWIEGTDVNYPLHYRVNPDNGGVTPTDPIKAYQFLKPLIKGTQNDTIFALSRWIGDHLWHGPVVCCTPEQGLTLYQYKSTAPPLEKIFIPTVSVESADTLALGPRYWSWCGCRSTAGLMVWMMRIINIPSKALGTFIEDHPTGDVHRGIDFPLEELFSEHTDNFYAEPRLLDPTIEPAKIYTSANDYLPLKKKFTEDQPLPGEKRKDYHLQHLGKIALSGPTHEVVREYWKQIQYPHVFLLYLQNRFKFTVNDSVNLKAQYENSLINKIDEFKQQNQQEISQELNKPGNENKSTDEVAYELFVKKYTEWELAR